MKHRDRECLVSRALSPKVREKTTGGNFKICIHSFIYLFIYSQFFGFEGIWRPRGGRKKTDARQRSCRHAVEAISPSSSFAPATNRCIFAAIFALCEPFLGRDRALVLVPQLLPTGRENSGKHNLCSVRLAQRQVRCEEP